MALGFPVWMENSRLLVKFFALFCVSFIIGVIFLHSTTQFKTSVVSGAVHLLFHYISGPPLGVARMVERTNSH